MDMPVSEAELASGGGKGEDEGKEEKRGPLEQSKVCWRGMSMASCAPVPAAAYIKESGHS